MKKRPQLEIVGHYFEQDGERIAINPETEPELARVKPIWEEALTGNKYEIENAG